VPVAAGGRLISQDLANSALEVATPAPNPRARPAIVSRDRRRVRPYRLRDAQPLPESTYTIVDIPPAIDISRWYLGQLFGSERLRFVAPDEVDSVAGGSIDAALSISSLQEMTPDVVAGHLRTIDRVAAGGHVYLKQWRRGGTPTTT
jgi:hypothetical protein